MDSNWTPEIVPKTPCEDEAKQPRSNRREAQGAGQQGVRPPSANACGERREQVELHNPRERRPNDPGQRPQRQATRGHCPRATIHRQQVPTGSRSPHAFRLEAKHPPSGAPSAQNTNASATVTRHAMARSLAVRTRRHRAQLRLQSLEPSVVPHRCIHYTIPRPARLQQAHERGCKPPHRLLRELGLRHALESSTLALASLSRPLSSRHQTRVNFGARSAGDLFLNMPITRRPVEVHLGDLRLPGAGRHKAFLERL